jgi:chromosome segregation ATPase
MTRLPRTRKKGRIDNDLRVLFHYTSMATNIRRSAGEIKASNDALDKNATDGGALANTNDGPFGDLDETVRQRIVVSGAASELDETGEFPPLDLAAAAAAAAAAEAADAADAAVAAQPEVPPDVPDARASFWLKHLESEIERLQSRWEVVADELRLRQNSIEQLRVESESKDAAADRLREDISVRDSANNALQTELDQANARLAEFAAAQAERDMLVAQRSREVEELRDKVTAQQNELAVSAVKTEQLTAELDHVRAEMAIALQRHENQLAANNQVRERVQELEAYIDGRTRSWSELNEKVAHYQGELARIEKVVAAQEVRFAKHVAEKDKLVAAHAAEKEKLAWSRVAEKDELVTSHAVELEQLTAAHAAELHGLTSAYAAEKDELTTSHAAEKDKVVTTHAAELDRLVKSHADEKDTLIGVHTAEREQLSTRVAELERSCAELTTQRNERHAAADNLDARLREQTALGEKLRTELSAAQKSGAEAGVQLAQRTELVASLERGVARREQTIADLEELVRLARAKETQLGEDNGKLSVRVAELDKIVADRDTQVQSLKTTSDSAERGLRETEQLVEKLERLLHGTAKEITDLQDGVAVRDRKIERMLAELRAKQDALDLLERNAQKLNDLGASLKGLDRKFSTTEVVMTKLRPVPSSPAAAGVVPVFDVGRPLGDEPRAASGKMIIAVDGPHRRTYPLTARDVTIGRSPESDIRIQSAFVSRLHARIFVQDADTLIEDLGSKNGVLVNAKPVEKPSPLHHGDIICLGGNLQLKYVDLDRYGDPSAA